MSDQQPEALRLADKLDVTSNGPLDFKHKAAAELRRLHEIEIKYHELLFNVGSKFADETRHQTALRYIRQMENDMLGAAIAKAQGEQEWPEDEE